MSEYKTNKAEWRSVGDREYVCLEVRPPRKKKFQGDGATSVVLDFLPKAGSGAYKAYSALIEVQLATRGEEQSRRFYAELEGFCRRFKKREL